jgi:hypothetical protein
LTSSQQAAREFWRQAGADGMPPFYVMSQYYAQLSANSDNLPVVTAAIEQLLTGLGYATDVDTVFGELHAGQGEELGYWAGHYCLFDSDGNRFDLVVGRNGATLTVPPALVEVTPLPAGTDIANVTVLNGAGFDSDGKLQLKNAQFQASLSFALPVKDEMFDNQEQPVTAMFQSTASRCEGTFAPVGDGAAGSRPVKGKRGAWTNAGVNQDADGDPAAAWYGQYVLLDMTEVMAVVQTGGDADKASVVQEPNPVYIYNDPSFGLTFQWGNRYGSNLTYNNNVLQCADEDDDRTQYAMQFLAAQGGAAELNLAVTKAGVVRSYKGYWVGRYPPRSPALQTRRAKRPMTAVYSAGSDASAGGYSQAIDVSSLSAGAPNKIGLPCGAVGNPYALSLNLTGCAAGDKFSWAVTEDPTGRASIAPGGDGNQTALFSINKWSDSDLGQQLQVTVQLTKTSPEPSVIYTLLLDVTVIQCEPITLEPTVLPPVVVGAAYTYTQKLVAAGARGNFTWSVMSSSLPPGLTWDGSSHQLSGTVTDAAQVGKAFSLVLGLAASDVVMDPLTVSLVITVQPASAVASGMPLWEEILLYGQGGLVALIAIVAFAANRIKAARTEAKAAAAAREGKAIVETLTRGNPKLWSNIVVQGVNRRLSIIKDDVSISDRLIQHVNDLTEGLNAKHEDAEALYEKLINYLANNPPKEENPDAPVNDPDLNAKGYKTERDVVSAAGKLVNIMNDLNASLMTLADFSNQLTTRIRSNRDQMDEQSHSEPNDEHLSRSD